MSQAIILKGGAGGVGSDDVTASKAQVLKGYKTVTTDSDDEIVEGEMVNRGNGMNTVEFLDAYWENKYIARMEQGFYAQIDQWKPYVAIPYAVLANGIHLDANKMLDTLQVSGVRGKIKTINTQDNNYRANKSTAFGIDGWSDVNNPVFWIDFPHGNGYYHRADNHPHTCINAENLGNATADKVVAGSTFTSINGVNVQGQIVDRGDGAAVSFAQGREDWASRMWVTFKNGWYHRGYHPEGHEAYTFVTYEQLKNLFGIDANQMLQGYGIAGVQGAISRWVCNTGDVITALGGEGFVWDDTHASRGRGIVVKIPNGRYIQGANWVFLPSPNLQPWNIRKGVNINGVNGTMEDPNVGRVPFRNATFDNVLISGVANIGLGKNLNNYSVPSTEIRDGIIRFDTRWVGLHWYAPESTLNESITLAHSVNLSPFKTVRLGIKFPYGGNWGAVNSMGDLVGVVWALSTNHYAEYNPYVKIKVNPNMVKKTGTSRVIPQVSSSSILDKKGLDIPTGAEYFVDVDVSDLQGHHRIVLGFAVINPAGDKVTSRVAVRATNDIFGISHIEFIN